MKRKEVQIGDCRLILGLVLTDALAAETGLHSTMESPAAFSTRFVHSEFMTAWFAGVVGSQFCGTGRRIPRLFFAMTANHNFSGCMNSRMKYPRGQFKVTNPVVCLYAVLVVHKFSHQKGAAKVLFHDDAVLASAVIVAVPLRAKHDVPGAVDSFPCPVTLASRSGRGFALKTTAAFDSALAHGFAGYRLFSSAIAGAPPIVVAGRVASMRMALDE